MKYALFAALSMFSVFATASPPVPATRAPVTVQYDYTQDLDIARVVSIKVDDPDSCAITHANMVYIDSKGVTHSLDYSRLGNGCQSG